MPRSKQPETSVIALNTGIDEPVVRQEQPCSQCDQLKLDPPQSEPGPPILTAPGIGHNRGPPQLEEGDTLNGAKEIHDYLCRLLSRKQSFATTYWQINRGLVPARKFGRFYLASKRGIAQQLAIGTGLAA